MKYVVGVDIGTSSTKAVLFDVNGRQIARSAQRYELKSPEVSAAEQSPEDILQAATQTVADVVAKSGIDPAINPVTNEGALLAVSFSCAMHTLLLLDADDRPITPVFTWADNRSDRYTSLAKKLDAEHNASSQSLYGRTGIPAHPMSPAIKLIWLRHERPDVFEKAARIVCIKEYVLWHWCREWVIDCSMASTTGLFNIHQSDWDAAALSMAGVRAEQLSEIVPTTHQLALGEDYAEKMGLRHELPIVVGASDGVLANLGVGAIAPDTAAITLGTSGAVRRVVSRPTTEPDTQLFCYALSKTQWVMGGAVNNGGITLQWTRDSLVPYSIPPNEKDAVGTEPSASTYERMNAMAQTVPPGSEGLIFHPYLLGERAPLWNAQASASFFGLGRRHSQAHLVRAVMEGVIYNMYAVFQALEKASGPIEKLRASGGFAHSVLWQQILADVFNRSIEIPTVIESSALGAAGLALVALGEWESLDVMSDRVSVADDEYPADEHAADGQSALAAVRQPIPENVERYQRLLPVFTGLTADFEKHYTALQTAINQP